MFLLTKAKLCIAFLLASVWIARTASVYNLYFMVDICLDNVTSIILGQAFNSTGMMKAFRNEWEQGPKNCTISLIAQKHDGIVINVQSLNFQEGCEKNKYLQFTDGDETVKLCESHNRSINKSALTSIFYKNAVNISYNTGDGDARPEFRFVFTAFKKGPCTDRYSFRCSLGTCIYKQLVCDSRNNCGDNSDEEIETFMSRCMMVRQSTWMWLAMVMFLPFVLVGCALGMCVFLKRRKTMRFHHIGSVHRQSRTCHEVSSPSLLQSSQTAPLTQQEKSSPSAPSSSSSRVPLDNRNSFQTTIHPTLLIPVIESSKSF
ncbi:uncharacterized protein LOC118182657 [Stegodyphus dumicola]|uniref:uncharacterized protein LOC118182657 n=1 Tax=Stegodyphus dumicola TaxID=202533 RepID=UPI0015B37A85|nr:uncharacterized protein LOC118182657 [Stegodyphus dumicola]